MSCNDILEKLEKEGIISFEDIYNELKKERLDLCYKEASKKRESLSKG